jgi:hypothetical protein
MRRLGVILAVAVFAAGVIPTSVGAQAEITAVITTPVEGQQLFGPVNITGSAGHATAFTSYTLEYDNLNDAAQQWFLVQEQVTQQVQDGVLGTWNTNMVPDGVYQIRLRVFLTDEQTGEFIVSNLRVVNSQPTPVPTVASGLADTTQVTLTPGGPTPTSPIVQPPSNDPVSGDAISGPVVTEIIPSGETAVTSTSSESRRINMGRVREAFCSGVYLALGLFAIMLVYSVIRRRLRPYTRRLVWQTPDETDRDL